MDRYIGQMLDNRYEILEVIGTGGMAYVYKALCHRLNRLVAVKILKEEFAQDDEFRRRFHAESQAVAMLSHPNIVAVYDVSRTSEVEYIVMELIDGITLKQFMTRKGQLSWREALHFVTQIVKALGHAHGRGIIHRDIKPHNIMILRDGSVKVADFGIARFAAQQNTLTREALGSVHYISPEQARGSHLDARSDIYSVGVVLYEMLTGRLPYEGDSAVSVAIQHINAIPLSPREINPDIPEALEAITMKAMSSSLNNRYLSADAMLRDLEEFRKNPSISFDYENISPFESPEPTLAIDREGTVSRIREEEKKISRSREETEYQRKKRNRTITALTGVLAVLLFIIGMVVLFVTVLSSGDSGRVETRLAPDLERKMLADVLEDPAYEWFEIVEDPEKVSTGEYAAGMIVSQDPKKNTELEEGGKITVRVSAGVQSIPMPDYSAQSYQLARTDLASHGLVASPTVIYEKSDDVIKDYVVRTQPEAGAPVYPGDTVTFVVSSGQETPKSMVPPLVGLTEAAATRLLQQYDLRSNTIRVPSEKPAGEVLSQSIDAGELVDAKTVVMLEISVGPAETMASEPSESTTASETEATTGAITLPTEEPTTAPTTATTTAAPTTTTIQTTATAAQTVHTFPVRIPEGDRNVRMTVYQNGTLIRDESVSPTQGTVNLSISGEANDTIEVYFDGVKQYSGPLSR